MSRAVISTVVLLAVALLAPPAGADDVSFCDEQVRRAPGRLESYSCYGTLAMRDGLWDEAVQRLDGHIAFDPDNTYALGALAYIEKARGRPRAEDLLRRILEIEDDRPDTPLLERLWVRLELADYLQQLYRLDEAEDVLAEALALATDGGDAVTVAQVRINQAWQAWRRADYGRAGLILEAVKDDVFPDGNASAQSIWLSAMGAVQWAQGAYDAAAECYRRRAALLESFGASYGRAGALYNIALVTVDARARRDRPTADTRVLFQTAVDAAAAVGDGRVESAALAELAILADSVAERRRLLRRGLDLARRANAVDSELANLRSLVFSLMTEEPRHEAAARRLLDDLDRRTREIGDVVQTALTRSVHSTLRWWEAERDGANLRARQRAVQEHLALLEAVETVRDRQPETLTRARTFSRWRVSYTSLVSRLLQPPGHAATFEELDLAFQAMERMRARLLLDEMDAARVTGELLDEDDPRVRERDVVLQQIATTQRALLDPSLSADRRSGLLQQLERLEVQEATVRQEILRSAERLAALRQPAIPSLTEIQQILADDEALFVYQVDGPVDAWPRFDVPRSHLLVVTTQRVRHFDLPSAAEIQSHVELFVGLCANRDGSERVGAARLYRDLLGPALSDLGPRIRRLIVAPDGVLHRLPFAAVIEATGLPDARERLRIALVPSAAVLARWRAEPLAVARKPALALVDPEIPGSGASEWALGVPDDSATARFFLPWSTLAPLPGARVEASAIRRHLGRRTSVIEGRDATEQILKRTRLSDYAVVHLAAHAVVDEVAPQRSAIVLAAGDDDEDGLLQVREVVDLDLEGSVVVLSACRSASGYALETEGMISLARAFLVSGARAVVGSLWPLRDDEAAAFFERFYAHLGDGASIDTALAAAQIDRRRAGAPAGAWAGIVLIGNGSIVAVSDLGSIPRWLAAVVAGLLAAAILWGLAVWRRASTPRSG